MGRVCKGTKAKDLLYFQTRLVSTELYEVPYAFMASRP